MTTYTNRSPMAAIMPAVPGGEPAGQRPDIEFWHGTRASAQTRLARLDAVLDRQTSHALLRAQAEPPGYLVALLGPRPTGQHTTAWDDAARRVEHYRHHHVGLPHGTPAISGDADPAHAALGNRPPDQRAAAAYDQAYQLGSDVDPQLPL